MRRGEAEVQILQCTTTSGLYPLVASAHNPKQCHGGVLEAYLTSSRRGGMLPKSDRSRRLMLAVPDLENPVPTAFQPLSSKA